MQCPNCNESIDITDYVCPIFTCCPDCEELLFILVPKEGAPVVEYLQRR